MKYLMKSICKKNLGMGVTFRDESSDGNYLMICYSDHSLIMRSKVSLDSSRDLHGVVGVVL